jgi:hypothetical protein
MKKTKTVLVCLGIILTIQSFSQDIPLGTLPMLFNGGFAGEGENARVTTGIGGRNGAGWSREKMFNYFGSYDQFLPKLRTGIGVTLIRSHYNYYISSDTASYDHRKNAAIISLSPKFSFKGKYTLAPFADFAYSTHEDSQLGDFLNRRIGIRTGFLFNARKFYAGVTYNTYTKHYTMNSYFLESYERYPLILQVGYTFQRLPESNFSFTPQFAFFIRPNPSLYEDRLDFDFNLMFRYKKFIGSFNNNGLGLGMQTNKFRVLLSQNYMFFKNTTWHGTLSMRYIFK